MTLRTSELSVNMTDLFVTVVTNMWIAIRERKKEIYLYIINISKFLFSIKPLSHIESNFMGIKLLCWLGDIWVTFESQSKLLMPSRVNCAMDIILNYYWLPSFSLVFITLRWLGSILYCTSKNSAQKRASHYRFLCRTFHAYIITKVECIIYTGCPSLNQVSWKFPSLFPPVRWLGRKAPPGGFVFFISIWKSIL